MTDGWRGAATAGGRPRLTVWAPAARRVEAVLYDDHGSTETGRTAMGHGPVEGWWQAAERLPDDAVVYAFSIDGGPPRPDPRSQSQPFGVDGPSRLVDHSAFEWGTGEERWRGVNLEGAALYETHIGTFSTEGTFDGALEHLDHLAGLGVDAIELCPVAEFSGERGWGYDGVDLFAPHHAYGGPDGLKRLVRASHERGLGVVLDVVYNHLGPAGNYLADFGPYFTTRHSTNWGDAVNFDGPGSDEVRRFVLDNALMWFRDYHVDGLRLDAVHAIADDSAVHILEELARATRAAARQRGKPLFLVAESDRNDPRYVRSLDANGLGMDAAWADEFHHALHAVLTGERTGYYEDFGSLDLLAKACRQAWVYTGEYSGHRGRHFGRPPTALGAGGFVVFLQNHDQVGNRARGERIAELCGPARARIGAALTVLSPFVPMLFQGEEWAASAPFQYFTDHSDPALGARVTQGRREEFADFGWGPDDVPDPQDAQTFERSKLDWYELEKEPHAEMLAWYKELLALREAFADVVEPSLGATTTRHDEDEGWLVVERGALVIAANLARETRRVPCGGEGLSVRLASGAAELHGGELELGPETVAVLTR